MHILLGVLGLISAAAVWYWRYQALKGAAGDLGKAADTVANLPRRLAFLNKSRQGGVKLIEDPREAASIMMVLVAQEGGLVTERHQEVMREAAERLFEFNAEEADTLIDHAAWVSRADAAPHAIMTRMANVVLNAPAIGPKELVELDEALVEVSEAAGAPTSDQMRLLQIYRDKTGIKA